MNCGEKLLLARQLEQLGVDVIEAGFPIASPGDLEAVRAVAAEILGCRVAALARARQEDVNAALRALEPAAKPRLHIFLATSDLHLKHKLRITRQEALEQVAKMVLYGRMRCDEVEFSAEDASRSDLDYLCDVVEAAAERRRYHNQSSGYCRIFDAGRIWRDVSRRAQAACRVSECSFQRALPQRPGSGGGKFAGSNRRRSAAGGVHDQRDRRARRKRVT